MGKLGKFDCTAAIISAVISRSAETFLQISGMHRIDDGHTLSLLACAFTRTTGRNFQIEGEIEKEGGTADLIGLAVYCIIESIYLYSDSM